MKKVISFFLTIMLVTAVFTSCSGNTEENSDQSTTAPQTTRALPPIDEDVPQSLRSFYQSTLPSMGFKSGVTNPETGAEISCSFDMLQKSAFVDFDSDGVKEIVLLYDISEEAGMANQDVAVFLDERDGQPGVVYIQVDSFGISDSEESYLLSYHNDKICLVRIVKYESCEAVLVQQYGANGWTSVASAYHHISDHDSVQLEEDSYYVDHASGGLFNAVTGNSVYSVEKFRNYRIPQEAYDGLINNFAAMAVLP